MTVTLASAKAYLTAGGQVSQSDAQITSALAAEGALQRRSCRFPDVTDVTQDAEDARAVLDEALCRRIAVNLARRGLPLGMQMTEVGGARLTSSNDPEVRRMEGPYRKVAAG